MTETMDHVITVQPAPDSDGATSYRPACSCGHAWIGIWDTYEGAERAGQRHVASEAPRKPGRYVMEFEDGWITLRCNECRETVAGWQGSGDYATNGQAARDAANAHEEERHA